MFKVQLKIARACSRVKCVVLFYHLRVVGPHHSLLFYHSDFSRTKKYPDGIRNSHLLVPFKTHFATLPCELVKLHCFIFNQKIEWKIPSAKIKIPNSATLSEWKSSAQLVLLERVWLPIKSTFTISINFTFFWWFLNLSIKIIAVCWLTGTEIAT
jgi:hypothetical protein